MNYADILQALKETLLMSGISTLLAYLFGLPTGVILNITSKNGLKPNRAINLILGTLINILRSIPCLIIVVIFIPVVRNIFSQGTGAWYCMIIPLFITSYGFVSRMCEQSFQEVPYGEIEAVKSLGASSFQLISKVLIPESKVSLITGFGVTSISIIGFTSFAYNIGSGGLIASIWQYYSKHTGSYLQDFTFYILILLVIILVQGIQELSLIIAKKIDKRRIRKQ